jgi:hypothetical protein
LGWEFWHILILSQLLLASIHDWWFLKNRNRLYLSLYGSATRSFILGRQKPFEFSITSGENPWKEAGGKSTDLIYFFGAHCGVLLYGRDFPLETFRKRLGRG